MSNYIGPITTEKVHIRDGNETKRDGAETINLVCSVEQAHQLRGLCENSVKNIYGSLRILNTQESRWGILPVNTSENLKVNEHQTHSGLYHVKDIEIEAIGNRDDIAIVRIPVELLSKNVNEILTILHSKGGEDGSSIEMSDSYVDETLETLLDEEFTTFNTTDTWEAKYTENMASGADIVASSDKLVFSGASATNWSWGYLWTILRETVPEELYAEFTLEWNALPASGAAEHHINFFLVDGRPSNKTELEYKDVIRILIRVKDSEATLEIGKRVRGKDSTLISPITLSGSEKTPAIKIRLKGGSGVSNLTVWVKKNYSSGTPSFTDGDIVFGSADDGVNTGVNFDNDRYLVLSQENASSTSTITRCAFLNLYQYVDALRPNTVVAPVGAVVDQTATFTRVGSEGAVQCFKNPAAPPTFQVTPVNFFKGHVKGWNGNYPDSVSRLVTDNEFDLDPAKFFVSNGLIQLIPGDDFVNFGYWDGTGWQTLNTFTFPSDILLIRPFLVTPWTFILQIDRTLWKMNAGKPHVWVKHPVTPLGFNPGTCYYHDGTTTVPDNILTANQESAETNTDGFLPAIGGGSTETLSNATDWFKVGSKSLKCVTQAVANSGILFTGITPVPGVSHAFYASLKADVAGKTMHLYLWDQDWNGLATPVEFVTTGAEQVITITGVTASDDTGMWVGVTNDSAEIVTFRVDDNHLEAEMVNQDITMLTQFYCNIWKKGYGTCASPSPADRYRLQIISPSPRTIKSDSIPAAELTGIGVYDSTIAANSDDSYLYRAREWFEPTWQTLLLQSEV